MKRVLRNIGGLLASSIALFSAISFGTKAQEVKATSKHSIVLTFSSTTSGGEVLDVDATASSTIKPDEFYKKTFTRNSVGYTFTTLVDGALKEDITFISSTYCIPGANSTLKIGYETSQTKAYLTVDNSNEGQYAVSKTRQQYSYTFTDPTSDTISFTCGSGKTSSNKLIYFYSIEIFYTEIQYNGVVENGKYYIVPVGQDSSVDSVNAKTSATVGSLPNLDNLPFDFKLVSDGEYEISALIGGDKHYFVFNSAAKTFNANSTRLTPNPSNTIFSIYWNIVKNDDNTYSLVFHNIEGTSIYLAFNTTNGNVLCHQSLDYNNNCVYKFNIVEEKDMFGTNFLKLFTSGCFAEGGHGAINWEQAIAQFNKLSEEGKESLQNLILSRPLESYDGYSTGAFEEACARYDYIVGKYGTAEFSDFMNRNPSYVGNQSKSGLLNIFSSEINIKDSSNLVFIVITIGTISLVSFVTLKKRRQY